MKQSYGVTITWGSGKTRRDYRFGVKAEGPHEASREAVAELIARLRQGRYRAFNLEDILEVPLHLNTKHNGFRHYECCRLNVSVTWLATPPPECNIAHVIGRKAKHGNKAIDRNYRRAHCEAG